MKSERFLIIFLVVAAAVVASFFMSPIHAAAIIPAITFGIILLGNPRVFLFVYLGVMSIYPLLNVSIPAGPIQYVNELMGSLLCIMFIAHLSLRRLDFSRIRKWKSLAFFFLGYVALTWAFNRVPVRPTMQCLFSYLIFIPFYILCINYLKRSDFYVLLKGSIWFFWLNFILNIGWFLRINPLFNYHLFMNNMVDVGKGTLEGCNYVAYFCILLFFLFISVLNSKILVGRKALRVWILITLPMILLQIYFSYTNHSYVIFLLAFVPYGAVSGLWKKWQSLCAVALVGGAILLAVMFSEYAQKQFDKETLRDRSERLVYSAKVQVFNDLAVTNLREYPLEWALGAGPGYGVGGLGKVNSSPQALRMLLNYYQAFDTRAMQMTSITGLISSAVFTLWGDFGIIGLIMFSCLYVSLYIQCLKTASSGGDGTQKKVIAVFLVVALVVFTVINILIDLLMIAAITLWLWVWLAMFTLAKEAPVDPDSRAKIATGQGSAGEGQAQTSKFNGQVGGGERGLKR